MSINKMDEQLTKIKVWMTFLNNIVDKGYSNNSIMLDTLVNYLDNYNMENINYSISDSDNMSESESNNMFVFEYDNKMSSDNDDTKKRIMSSSLYDLKIEPYNISPPNSPVQIPKQKPVYHLVPNVEREKQKIDKFLNTKFEDNIESFIFYSTNGKKSIDRMNKFVKSTKFI